MPNIQGDYSLTEIATKLNVSASWINSVQKQTGICAKESTQGKRAEFTSQDIKTLKNVKFLRMLDFSLEDIKNIYELERQYIDLLKNVQPTEDVMGEIPAGCISAIIGSYFIPTHYLPNAEKVSPKEEAERDKLLSRFFKISEEVEHRFNRVVNTFVKKKKLIEHNKKIYSELYDRLNKDSN
jgi:DNA-binding transcriptional MerR regulator